MQFLSRLQGKCCFCQIITEKALFLPNDCKKRHIDAVSVKKFQNRHDLHQMIVKKKNFHQRIGELGGGESKIFLRELQKNFNFIKRSWKIYKLNQKILEKTQILTNDWCKKKKKLPERIVEKTSEDQEKNTNSVCVCAHSVEVGRGVKIFSFLTKFQTYTHALN